MRNAVRRRPAAFAVVALALAASGVAQGADDYEAASSLVQKLEKDAAHLRIYAEAAAHAKEALERATRLRAVGDEPRAKAADGLAREWAETARDLTRAADAEATAADLRRKAVDAQARLERVRLLVEAGIVRVGRLKSEIEEASRASSKDRTAGEVHDGEQASRKKTDPKGKP